MRRSLLLLSLTTIAGCGEVGMEDEVGSREAAIVNGVPDTAHAAVGVLHAGGSSACTATLIGPRTVLTAGHCVARETAPYELLSPVNYYPEGFSGPKILASAVFVHPSYAGGNRADIAIVQLSTSVAAQPAKLNGLAPTLGEMVDVVGFGKTGEETGDFGERRHATNSIGKIDAQTFRVFGATGELGNVCNGDSGGPTFATRDGKEVLIGVHSTKGGLCGQEGIDIRVDVFLNWIIDTAAGDVTAERVPAAAPTPSADANGPAAGGFAGAEEPSTAAGGELATDGDEVQGGCSVTGSSGSASTLMGVLLMLGLAVALRRRAR